MKTMRWAGFKGAARYVYVDREDAITDAKIHGYSVKRVHLRYKFQGREYGLKYDNRVVVNMFESNGLTVSIGIHGTRNGSLVIRQAQRFVVTPEDILKRAHGKVLVACCHPYYVRQRWSDSERFQILGDWKGKTAVVQLEGELHVYEIR